MRYASSDELSPIARKQHALYQGGMPRITGPARLTPSLVRRLGRLGRLGYLGAAGSSVWSGPPVGQGAGGGAKTGAEQGAALGTTIVPGIGTAIGLVAGAIGGAISGALGKKDPEQYNFDAAVNMWQQNPNAVYSIGNKYLPLAGLFDLSLKGPHIPIYQKYGRRGEERFTADLANLIYSAAQQGKITANDTPLTIMVNVVQPWIDQWGFGPMSDPHQDLINKLIIGMIADYTSGAAPQVWRARGGDLPASFRSIPPFSLPQAAPPLPAPPAPVPASAPTPAPVATPAPVPTTVAIPAGYVLVGMANGMQAYQGLDGLYYSWNGAQMSLLTGTLVTATGQSLSVVNGQVQTGGGAMTLPALPMVSMGPPVGAPATPAPIASVPATAGVSTAGAPPWITWGALAGAAYLLLATARPASKRHRTRAP